MSTKSVICICFIPCQAPSSWRYLGSTDVQPQGQSAMAQSSACMWSAKRTVMVSWVAAFLTHGPGGPWNPEGPEQPRSRREAGPWPSEVTWAVPYPYAKEKLENESYEGLNLPQSREVPKCPNGISVGSWSATQGPGAQLIMLISREPLN